MEFFLEVFFSAALSIFVAFLFSKLFSKASTNDVQQDSLLLRSEKGVIMEETNFEGGLKKNRVMKIKNRVEFVEEPVTVHEFEGEFEQEKLGMVHVGVEFVEDCCGVTEICEVDRIDEVEEDCREKLMEVTSGKEEDKDEVKADESDLMKVKEEKISTGDDELEDNLVGEKSEKTQDPVIDVDLLKDVEILAKNEQIEILGFENKHEIEIEGREKSGAEDEKMEMFSDDDDWEGIETSEMEKLFGAAVAFVGHGDKENCLSNVGSDVQMQLNGLYKLATEGPCHEPQPMALNFSARAKWNAWQRMGNMSPEVAMERYIATVSDCFPGWMRKNAGEESKQDSLEAGVSETQPPDLRTDLHHQMGSEFERVP